MSDNQELVTLSLSLDDLALLEKVLEATATLYVKIAVEMVNLDQGDKAKLVTGEAVRLRDIQAAVWLAGKVARAKKDNG